jgi:hypothetical protein
MRYAIVNGEGKVIVTCVTQALRDKLFFHMKFSLEIDCARVLLKKGQNEKNKSMG